MQFANFISLLKFVNDKWKKNLYLNACLSCVYPTIVCSEQTAALLTLDLLCENVQQVLYFFLHLLPQSKHFREKAGNEWFHVILHAVDIRLAPFHFIASFIVSDLKGEV